MTIRYFGMYDAEGDEFTMVISATDEANFLSWFREFTAVPPDVTDEQVVREFKEEGQTIRECTVVLLT